MSRIQISIASCECLIGISWLQDYLDGEDTLLFHSPVCEIHEVKEGNEELADVAVKPPPLQCNYKQHTMSWKCDLRACGLAGFPSCPVGESAKLGINTPRASHAGTSVDFWLIRNSTKGIPISMCHLHALKPDVLEAKDESSLRDFLFLVWTHICKSATLSPFKAPFLQHKTCSTLNKG